MYSGIIFSRRSEPPEDVRLPRSCWAFYDRVDGSTPTAAIADALDLSQEETFAAVHGLQSLGLIEETVVTYEAYSAPDSARAPAPKPDSADADSRAPAPKPDSADADSADAESAGVDYAGDTSTPAGTSSAGTGRAPSGDGSAPAPGAPSLYPDDAEPAEASVDNGAGEDAPAARPTGESDEGSAAREAPAADASPDDPPADDPPADEGPVDEAFSGEEHLGDASFGGRSAESPDAAPDLHLPSFWAWLEEHAPNVKEYKNTQAFILMETSGPLSRIGIDSMDDLQELERCDDPEVVEALEAAVENNLNESIPSSCYQ